MLDKQAAPTDSIAINSVYKKFQSNKEQENGGEDLIKVLTQINSSLQEQ